jgi:hypothetical protein
VRVRWGDKEWVKEVEKVYWAEQDSDVPTHTTVDVLVVSIIHEIRKSDAVAGLRVSWFNSMDEKAEAQRRTLFRTEYRAVESEVDGLLVRWYRHQQAPVGCMIRYTTSNSACITEESFRTRNCRSPFGRPSRVCDGT